MARYGMVIDVGRCIGCYNCFLTCRDEHAGHDRPGISLAQPAGQKWIDVRETERGSFSKVRVSHVPVPCLHCEDGRCLRAAAGGAVYRRPDGIVLIDPDKAAGRRELADACPYGVIFWNESRNLAQKCTLCAHLLDAGWKEPRCVEVCPTQAIVFGDLTDKTSAVAQSAAAAAIEDLHPEFNAKPAVRYIGLPKRFVAGEIAFADKTEMPAEGVRVLLARGGKVLTAATDNYGDFVFDGVDEDADYRLRVEHPGYTSRDLAVSTRTDVNVGTIVLEPTIRRGS